MDIQSAAELGRREGANRPVLCLANLATSVSTSAIDQGILLEAA